MAITSAESYSKHPFGGQFLTENKKVLDKLIDATYMTVKKCWMTSNGTEIEQALQQGVAAHRKGKLEEAERLYRAILQSQQVHSVANYNLGLLPAPDSNQRYFWLFIIDALIKAENLMAQSGWNICRKAAEMLIRRLLIKPLQRCRYLRMKSELSPINDMPR